MQNMYVSANGNAAQHLYDGDTTTYWSGGRDSSRVGLYPFCKLFLGLWDWQIVLVFSMCSLSQDS